MLISQLFSHPVFYLLPLCIKDFFLHASAPLRLQYFLLRASAPLRLPQCPNLFKHQPIIFILILLSLLLFTPPAIASVHRYPEASNGVMYRSLQTLRDRADHAWQLVLFKRMDAADQTESIHLRVVGFPGSVEVLHPAPLGISSSQQGWKAPDTLSENSDFPTNVGEYDVLQFATGLTSNAPLQLFLPTKAGAIALTIPPFVVQEWREVAVIQDET